MSALDPREAYRLWAPSYANETAISALDQDLALALSPPTAGKHVLDAGCGIGRRLPQDAALAVGIDASPEMLAAGTNARTAAADLRALPFADRSFDVIWCRLVLGHVPDLHHAYRELARVCRAHLLVSDFHSGAVAAGHTRSFRDPAGRAHEVEHHCHGEAGHISAAQKAGFILVARQDGSVGPSIRHFYEQAGRLKTYEADVGLALVAGFAFRRP